MINVDGITWDVPCQIDRTAEMTASDISGVLLNGNYFNDVMGTYMKYDISIAIPVGKESEYTELYDALTDPVDSHFFILPYNQTEIRLYARVETVSDRYYKQEHNKTIWRGTKFSLIANSASKVLSVDEIIERGISPTPTPEESSALIGEIYEYTENGWELYEPDYDDADWNEY